MNEDVKMVIKEGIAIARINRPEAANAMNSKVLTLLLELFEGLRNDAAVRGIVITGEP